MLLKKSKFGDGKFSGTRKFIAKSWIKKVMKTLDSKILQKIFFVDKTSANHSEKIKQNETLRAVIKGTKSAKKSYLKIVASSINAPFSHQIECSRK
jgi:hypothetical protein